MKCPKCLSKKLEKWTTHDGLATAFKCLHCLHTWVSGNNNIIQKTSGVKPEDLPDIVVAEPMTSPLPKKKPVASWSCLACGGANLEIEHLSDVVKCLDCLAEMTLAHLHSYYSKTKDAPPIANAKFWYDDFATDQTEFKFTIETRIVPHKWVPALHNNTGGWVAIQDEAFYSEPEEHEFAISSFLFRGNAKQIEQSLWDFLQAMYRQAAAKTWRKPVEYMIERFITPAIERYLSSKDWTKVPPVDESWLNELNEIKEK